jgi:radical SAM protein with 4Fe4S-binding SPASM domain
MASEGNMRSSHILRYLLNRYLGSFAYHHRQAKALSRPEVYAIETTNLCNLRCIMCPYPEMTRQTGLMSLDLFKKVISEIKTYSRYVGLHNFGEPLLNPDLPRFIAHAAEAGLKTWLSTNATLLTEAAARELLDSGLDVIIFSLDGVNRETYEKIRLNSRFEKTKANIDRFLDMKKSKNRKTPLTIVQIINMMNTESEIALFKKEWERKADTVLIKALAAWSDQVAGIRNLSRNVDQTGPAGHHRPPCLYLWRSFVVQWDGTVVLCCNDFDNKLVVGDVGRQTLREIWNSPLMRDLRSRHLRGDFGMSICRNCREWIGEPLRPLYPLAASSFRKAGKFLRGGFPTELKT